MTTSQTIAAPTPNAVLLALAVLVACGPGADGGGEGGDGTEGEVTTQPGDTVAAPPSADVDDPDMPPGATDLAQAETAIVAVEAAGDSAASDTLSPLSPPLRIPGGTEVTLTADHDISTDVYDAGDPVIATVIQDVVGADGTILIPRGVKFLGRVDAAAGSGGAGELPILEVSFETLSAWSYERPVETLVTHAPVTLDPEADRARRQAGGRDAMTVLPGRITAGSIIMVELREAVFVPSDAPMWLPGDSLAPEGMMDSVPRPDTVPRVDTVPRTGLEPQTVPQE